MKRLALVFLLLAAPAAAQEHTLVAYGTNKSVPVWKDLRSLREGTDMLQAGVHKRNPELVNSLLACFVPDGTKVVVSGSPALGVNDVLVTSGVDAGCRGSVNRESMDK